MSSLSVSVIIPTYNRAHLVCEAIDSCLAQTRVPDEIIVVDDGSTDETRAVLASYTTPVKVIHQPNAGRSAARNTGIEAASGDLIAFLDDDDTLTPDSIAVRASVLEQQPEYQVVYGDIAITDLDGKSQGKFSEITGTVAPSGIVFAAFAQRNLRPIHAFMIRRSCFEVIGKFDAPLSYFEDYDLWLKAAAHFEFYYLNEVLGDYRFHSQQTVAHKQREMQEGEVEVRARIFNTPAFSRMAPTQKARVYSVHATQHILTGDTKSARLWYWKAIQTAPWLLRPYLLLGFSLFGKQGMDRIGRLIRGLRTTLFRLTRNP